MSDRKAELEKKKAKLQAIREEKERRRREKEQKDVCIFILLLFSVKNCICTLPFRIHPVVYFTNLMLCMLGPVLRSVGFSTMITLNLNLKALSLLRRFLNRPKN